MVKKSCVQSVPFRQFWSVVISGVISLWFFGCTQSDGDPATGTLPTLDLGTTDVGTHDSFVIPDSGPSDDVDASGVTKPFQIVSPVSGTCIGGLATVVAVAGSSGKITAISGRIGDEQFPFVQTPGTDEYTWVIDTTTMKDNALALLVNVEFESGEKIEQTINVFVDNTAPKLQIIKPTDAQLVLGELPVKGTAEDASVCGLSRVQVTLDETPILVFDFEGEQPTLEATFGDSFDTSAMPTSKSTVVVSLYDVAGNVTSTSLPVYIVTPVCFVSATTTEQVTGLQFSHLRVAPYDKDGLDDVLLIGNSGIYLSTASADGVFSDLIPLLTNKILFAEPFDLNNDNLVDIVAIEPGNKAPPVVSIYVRKVSGDIVSGQQIPLDKDVEITDLLIVDVTGDIRPDIVFSTDDPSYSLGVLVGIKPVDGQYFENAVRWSTGVSNITDIEAGDFDGDGYSDVVVGSLGTSKVSVFRSDGEGQFFAAFDTVVEEDPAVVQPGLFNNDNHLDLVVATKSKGQVWFLSGYGNGYFKVENLLSFGGTPTDLVAGDFDNDQNLDVVTSFLGMNEVAISYTASVGSVADKYAVGPAPKGLAVGKFAEAALDDGLDVIAYNGGTQFTLLRGYGTRYFQGAPGLWNPTEPKGQSCVTGIWTVVSLLDIAVGQFDGKPGLDLAGITELYKNCMLFDTQGYEIYMYPSDGVHPTSQFTRSWLEAAYLSPHTGPSGSTFLRGKLLRIEPGDFNGDGLDDLVVANGMAHPVKKEVEEETPVAINADVWANNGVGVGFDRGVWVGLNPSVFQPEDDYQKKAPIKDLHVVDLDQNGRDDLVTATPYFADKNTGEKEPARVNPWLTLASGNLSPLSASDVSDPVSDPGVSVVRSGDVDGDGNVDILTVNSKVASVGIHYGIGGGNLDSKAYLYSALAPATSVAELRQLNGDQDAFPDLISVGSNKVFIAYGYPHKKGEYPFLTPSVSNYPGTSATSIDAADYNADGLSDVIITDSKEDVVYLYLNIGNRAFAPNPVNIYTSAEPGKVVAADLNEDGCADFAVMTKSGVTILQNCVCDKR